MRVGAGEERRRRGKFLVDVPTELAREQRAGLWRLIVYRANDGRWWAVVWRFRSRSSWRVPLAELVMFAARMGQRAAMLDAIARPSVRRKGKA